MTAHPPLVLAAHGTRDPAGQQVVTDLRDLVAARLPGVAVHAAYVDVQDPELATMLAGLGGLGDSTAFAVCVPLLLSRGFHTMVDIEQAAADRPVRVAPALGPDPVLAAVLLDRLAEAGVRPDDAVVLAVAGSSRPEGGADAEAMRGLLAERWGGPVSVGYLSAAEPSVPDAVRAARGDGRARVALAAYLLGPGHFRRRLESAGADVVAAPLGADPRLADHVVERYRAQAGQTRR